MGWLAAILSGIIAGFSYPTVLWGKLLPDLGFLAFFAWIPLFQALRDSSAKRAFALGFVAAFIQYLFSMYWLYTAMNSFGGLSSALSVLVLVLLAIILAAEFGIIFSLSQYLSRSLNLKVYWIRPFVWVALEYARGHQPQWPGMHPGWCCVACA